MRHSTSKETFQMFEHECTQKYFKMSSIIDYVDLWRQRNVNLWFLAVFWYLFVFKITFILPFYMKNKKMFKSIQKISDHMSYCQIVYYK